MKDDKESIKNQSTEKVLAIIELLAEENNPMRLQDISLKLKMNPSTTLRFLATLISCGYASQDCDTLKYYLTFKICAVANKVSFDINLRDILQPFTKSIAAVFNESVCVAVEQNMNAVYIDVVQMRGQMLMSTQRVGNAAPMHSTGVGKVLLTNHDEEYIERLVAKKGLIKFTENTITSKATLLDELDTIRKRGYSVDNEESEIGAKCIAVPVRDFTGKVTAGISITGPVSRMNEIMNENNISYLIQTAKMASQSLGYNY